MGMGETKSATPWSQIGVWDVLDGGHMMGMELVEFPSATNGRGVLSMVIAYVRCTMGKELWCSRQLLLGEESIVWWLRACQDPSMRLGCFTTGEVSVGQDYERDKIIRLDHEWVNFVGAQGSPKT